MAKLLNNNNSCPCSGYSDVVKGQGSKVIPASNPWLMFLPQRPHNYSTNISLFSRWEILKHNLYVQYSSYDDTLYCRVAIRNFCRHSFVFTLLQARKRTGQPEVLLSLRLSGMIAPVQRCSLLFPPDTLLSALHCRPSATRRRSKAVLSVVASGNKSPTAMLVALIETGAPSALSAPCRASDILLQGVQALVCCGC